MVLETIETNYWHFLDKKCRDAVFDYLLGSWKLRSNVIAQI
jgi:hypothetical protein